MPLRIPPGRAGRTWLTRRLEIGRRGGDVLEEKRSALLRERRRLEPLVAAAEADWLEAATAAEEWLARAIVLSGAHRLRLAKAYAGQAPTITVRWRNTLGVDIPGEPELELAPSRDVARIGGSAALAIAEEHHRDAIRAAARHAALRTAQERVTRELERTTRRLRAIERRWLPLHAEALSALELSLDEAEREDTARARWASERGSAASPTAG
jgi:V/A-type H+-transporting ATPase subunit D